MARSIAFNWRIRDASMPPRFARHLSNNALPMPCSRQRPATGTLQDRRSRQIALLSPAGQWMTGSSVYLLVFIPNLLVHLGERIPHSHPSNHREDCPAQFAGNEFVNGIDRCLDQAAIEAQSPGRRHATPALPDLPHHQASRPECLGVRKHPKVVLGSFGKLHICPWPIPSLNKLSGDFGTVGAMRLHDKTPQISLRVGHINNDKQGTWRR